jgi:DNA-binding response OmpR family regulator
VSARILVVDDDPGILDVVSYALREAGYEVETRADGPSALEAVQKREYDLVVLDVMLPGMSGTDVCRKLREEGQTLPVVMLTAKDAELDRVLGLELGADDYVSKPFSSTELVSRIRAIFRRGEYDRTAGAAVRQLGGLRLDFTRHQVTVDGTEVQLTPSEFKLLALFAEQPERVFSRRQLMEHLWESDFVGDEHACDVHISNLRKKIERDPAHPKRIVTVRAFGYKLVPA